MKIYLCAACFIAVYFFSGCTMCSTKKVPCNGFNEPAFAQWFPYTENTRLLFKNLASSDTFSYLISNVYKTVPYEATRGGYNNRTEGCISSIEISSDNNGTAAGYLDIFYSAKEYFDNGPVEKGMSISFKKGDWNCGEITATGFATISNIQAPVISINNNVLFENGITYPTVITLTNDTLFNKTEKAYKLFIAKNIGIIGCEIYPSKQKYVIQ